ncbi:MAG: transporter substrate-binding domain-containing protein [Acidobacteriota bacterium]|nr:MAG: transporter substrate-binding domain-containing protein [Acidobacteriota bacterium]
MRIRGWAICSLIACTFTTVWAQEIALPSYEDSPVFAEQTSDYDEIRTRGTLRVGVPYSRTNFFFENDGFRGFEFELFRDLEIHLNKSRRRGEPSLTVVFKIVPVADLQTSLLNGQIDIAAGFVITEERQSKMAFTRPYLSNISAVVVSNKSTPQITKVEQLTGKSVIVNRGSSYPGLLAALGENLKKQDLAPPKIEIVETLETEDIFEIINSGSASWTVAHEHHANLWQKVLPNLRVYSDLKIGDPARFAWGIRRQNPLLLEELNKFIAQNRQGTVVGNVLLKRYYDSTRFVAHPTAPLDQEKLRPLVSLFKKYGQAAHSISWLGLAAVAYQESKFDPHLKSRAGAVGLMQLRPETAAEVGVTGIEDPEQNVKAAALYFDLLAERYFNEAGLDRNDRVAFILAAYNAGPTRIQRIRREAAAANLDPNRWFGHVETLVLQKVGREPVGYVASVAKYYFSLSQILLTTEERSAEVLDLQ